MRPHDGGGGVCGGRVGVAVEEDDECLEGHTGTVVCGESLRTPRPG